jgi:hypothetical protein
MYLLFHALTCMVNISSHPAKPDAASKQLSQSKQSQMLKVSLISIPRKGRKIQVKNKLKKMENLTGAEICEKEIRLLRNLDDDDSSSTT